MSVIVSRQIVSAPGAAIQVTRIVTSAEWRKAVSDALRLGRDSAK